MFISSILLFAQDRDHNTISYRSLTVADWSNPNAFLFGPTPLIKGYGELSDSLKMMHDGGTFYEINDTYYSINTWADYYYWFTQRYWFMFRRPVLEYEFYYLTNNTIEMIKYIASPNYEGKIYPTTFTLDAPIVGNRLFDRSNFVQNETDMSQLNSLLSRNLYEKNPPINRRNNNNVAFIDNPSVLLPANSHVDGSSESLKGGGRSSGSSNSSGSSSSTSRSSRTIAN